ncbi:putative cytochrome p450 protein [Neofusicoccum parvum UCRNP2]|uniref:Putative cytochrome p450 protein n=1 Tax=Botryosphaeria parva (strain UCR-NP2) TaxID=1287680 RepID=R1GAG9_BOTPV|nr:putative cytochrome p450 protein [Neofusicoccum parvum UCRNP2]
MQAIKDFFNYSPIFDPRFNLRIHLLQLVLIVTAVILTFGAKSLIIIAYQLLTCHVEKFKKWASPKANAILNTLEIVFWAAVTFMVFQANLNSCTGTSCILSWIVVGLAGILHVLAMQTAVVSICDFRYFRKYGVPRCSQQPPKDEVTMQEVV